MSAWLMLLSLLLIVVPFVVYETIQGRRLDASEADYWKPEV